MPYREMLVTDVAPHQQNPPPAFSRNYYRKSKTSGPGVNLKKTSSNPGKINVPFRRQIEFHGFCKRITFPYLFLLQLHISQVFTSSAKRIPMTIYVSNLNFTVSDEQLKNVFNPYGDVSSAKVMTDKFTNRSRGFGFVDMPDDQQAQKAIDGLNGTNCEGRALVVNMAKPRKEF